MSVTSPSLPGEEGTYCETERRAPDCIFYKNCDKLPVKITSEAELDERGQRGQAWNQQLEMASVLSGWYGFHNIFNVANFIEYEPYPKRRKLDKSNNYLTTESLPPCEIQESNTRVRSHSNVSYRPYSDLHQHSTGVKQKSSKKQLSGKSDVAVRSRVQQDLATQQPEGTTIDDLFPEILCLIFEQLDLQSKGRVAQVTDRDMRIFYRAR